MTGSGLQLARAGAAACQHVASHLRNRVSAWMADAVVA